MRYAETGFQLEVDLSKGSIDKVETDPRDTELFLGGLGMDLKLLFDRVPPGTDPWSPDNLLIFGNGLLNGT
jgi:benzoyl-CoA reductase subunit BamB